MQASKAPAKPLKIAQMKKAEPKLPKWKPGEKQYREMTKKEQEEFMEPLYRDHDRMAKEDREREALRKKSQQSKPKPQKGKGQAGQLERLSKLGKETTDLMRKSELSENEHAELQNLSREVTNVASNFLAGFVPKEEHEATANWLEVAGNILLEWGPLLLEGLMMLL